MLYMLYMLWTTFVVRCGVCYAVDACIVSRSPQRLAKMMEVIVEVCRAFALTVSAKKTETISMPPPRKPRTIVRVEAAGQIYEQMQSFTYLGDPNGKGRGNRSPTVWMQYVDPSPGTLSQTPHRTPPGLASHHRGTAQEIRPWDVLAQPCP